MGRFRNWFGRRRRPSNNSSILPFQKGDESTVVSPVPFFQEPQPAKIPTGGTTIVNDGDSVVKILDWHQDQPNIRILACQTAKVNQFDYALLSREEALATSAELAAFGNSPEPTKPTDTKVTL